MKNLFVFARLNRFMDENSSAKNNFAITYDAVDKTSNSVVTVKVKPQCFDNVLDNNDTATGRILSMVDRLTDSSEENVIIFTNKTVVNTANVLYKLAGLACGAVDKDENGNETEKSQLVHGIVESIGLADELKKADKATRRRLLIFNMPRVYSMYVEAWNEYKATLLKEEDEEFVPFKPEVTHTEVQQLMSLIVVRRFKFMPLKQANKNTKEKVNTMTDAQKLYWENVNKVKEWFAKNIKTGSSIFADATKANVNIEISEEWEEL